MKITLQILIFSVSQITSRMGFLFALIYIKTCLIAIKFLYHYRKPYSDSQAIFKYVLAANAYLLEGEGKWEGQRAEKFSSGVTEELLLQAFSLHIFG